MAQSENKGLRATEQLKDKALEEVLTNVLKQTIIKKNKICSSSVHEHIKIEAEFGIIFMFFFSSLGMKLRDWKRS